MNSKVIEKKVESWDISWNYIEIISNLNWIKEICK
jgi:hypothetical protein